MAIGCVHTAATHATIDRALVSETTQCRLIMLLYSFRNYRSLLCRPAGRVALIPFLCAGDPNLDVTAKALRILDEVRICFTLLFTVNSTLII